MVPGPRPNGVSTSTFTGEHLKVPNLFTLLAVTVYFPGPTSRHHSPRSLVSSSTLSSSMRTRAPSTGLPCSSTTRPRRPPSAAARRAIKDLIRRVLDVDLYSDKAPAVVLPVGGKGGSRRLLIATHLKIIFLSPQPSN